MRSSTEPVPPPPRARIVRVIEVARKPMASAQVILASAVVAPRCETSPPPPPPMPSAPPSERCSSTTQMRQMARTRWMIRTTFSIWIPLARLSLLRRRELGSVRLLAGAVAVVEWKGAIRAVRKHRRRPWGRRRVFLTLAASYQDGSVTRPRLGSSGSYLRRRRVRSRLVKRYASEFGLRRSSHPPRPRSAPCGTQPGNHAVSSILSLRLNFGLVRRICQDWGRAAPVKSSLSRLAPARRRRNGRGRTPTFAAKWKSIS
jgi:hypothetical protein